MQANGAEMLRISCILMTKAGIRVCAPVHDAVLIEAPLEELDDRVKQAQGLMSEASKQVLDDLQYIRNWSIETAERVRSGCADLQNLQMELATMKVLSGILLENNRQRMDLFGLANKAKEVSDYSIDFIAAAREGGLNIKGPNSSDHPAEESDQT